MSRICNISSRIISVLCYPMLTPTLGVVFYYVFLHNLFPLLSNIYWWMLVIGTFFFTLFIPLTALLLLYKSGRITDIFLKDNRQRLYPYLYTLLGYAFWIWFLAHTMRVESYLLLVALGAAISLLIIMIINRHWKISAHLASMGGMLGAVAGTTVITGIFPITAICIVLCISLLLMCARLCLDAHTPLQVVAGYLLGLVSTSVPILIYYV